MKMSGIVKVWKGPEKWKSTSETRMDLPLIKRSTHRYPCERRLRSSMDRNTYVKTRTTDSSFAPAATGGLS